MEPWHKYSMIKEKTLQEMLEERTYVRGAFLVVYKDGDLDIGVVNNKPIIDVLSIEELHPGNSMGNQKFDQALRQIGITDVEEKKAEIRDELAKKRLSGSITKENHNQAFVLTKTEQVYQRMLSTLAAQHPESAAVIVRDNMAKGERMRLFAEPSNQMQNLSGNRNVLGYQFPNNRAILVRTDGSEFEVNDIVIHELVHLFEDVVMRKRISFDDVTGGHNHLKKADEIFHRWQHASSNKELTEDDRQFIDKWKELARSLTRYAGGIAELFEELSPQNFAYGRAFLQHVIALLRAPYSLYEDQRPYENLASSIAAVRQLDLPGNELNGQSAGMKIFETFCPNQAKFARERYIPSLTRALRKENARHLWDSQPKETIVRVPHVDIKIERPSQKTPGKNIIAGVGKNLYGGLLQSHHTFGEPFWAILFDMVKMRDMRIAASFVVLATVIEISQRIASAKKSLEFDLEEHVAEGFAQSANYNKYAERIARKSTRDDSAHRS